MRYWDDQKRVIKHVDLSFIFNHRLWIETGPLQLKNIEDRIC